MSLSAEQAGVVASVCSDPRNHVIQGVPGAGKSTVVMDIAKRRAGCSLLLTFSSVLKKEARKRCKKAGLRDRLFVHSYHSSVHGLFEGASVCPTDSELKVFLANNSNTCLTLATPKHAGINSINTLLLDEAQDMTQLYLELVLFILKTHSSISKIVVLGDYFQSLFRYNGSFTGLLERPEVYLGGAWAPLLKLSTSFRLPPGLCDWINTRLDPRKLREHYPQTWQEVGASVTLFWGDGIRPFSGHPLAEYTTGEVVKEVVYTDSEVLNGDVGSINMALEELGYERGDGLVVLSSLGKIGLGITPAIVNDRSEIAWSVKEGATSGSFDPDGIKSGLVCSSMYFKGMENGIVVTYLSAALEPRSEAECSDTLACLDAYSAAYVACTRSTQGLVLLRHGSTSRFFTERKVAPTGAPPGANGPTSPPRSVLRKTSVSAYLKFAHARSCEKLLDENTFLDIKVVSLHRPLDVAGKTHVDGVFNATTEDVYPLITRAIELALSVYWRTRKPFASKADWVDAAWMVLADAERLSGYKHLSRQIPQSFEWLDHEFMSVLLERTVALVESLPDEKEYTFQVTKLRIEQTIALFPPTLRHRTNESAVIIDWSAQAEAKNSDGVDTRRAICTLAAYKCTICHVIYPVLGFIRTITVAKKEHTSSCPM